MSKVNLIELPYGDFKHWLILTAISHYTKRFDKLVKAEGFDATKLDVKLVVNGVSFPMDHCFKSMEEQFDKETQNCARKLLLEKCNDINNMLYDIEQEIKCKTREVFPDLRLDD